MAVAGFPRGQCHHLREGHGCPALALSLHFLKVAGTVKHLWPATHEETVRVTGTLTQMVTQVSRILEETQRTGQCQQPVGTGARSLSTFGHQRQALAEAVDLPWRVANPNLKSLRSPLFKSPTDSFC